MFVMCRQFTRLYIYQILLHLYYYLDLWSADTLHNCSNIGYLEIFSIKTLFEIRRHFARLYIYQILLHLYYHLDLWSDNTLHNCSNMGYLKIFTIKLYLKSDATLHNYATMVNFWNFTINNICNLPAVCTTIQQML